NNLTTDNGVGSTSADGGVDGVGTLNEQNTAAGNGDRLVSLHPFSGRFVGDRHRARGHSSH
ncbi:MAG: hypothetical protein ACM3ZF_17120, partial [Mycobacterium leprae]